GWKRVLALKELGKTTVEAKVFPFEKEKIPDFLLMVYFDNKHRFNDLDKAEIINKFRVLCGFSDEDIIGRVLPELSIKPSKNNLNKFLAAASLDSETKKYFNDEYFTFEQLVMITEIEDKSYRDEITDKVLKKFQFNNNETREIIREIYEISKRENLTYNFCVEQIFSELKDKTNKNEFKKKVKFKRYPNLMEVEEEFKSNAKKLGSLNNINLFHHPFFETNEIEIRLKVNNYSQYLETIEKLSEPQNLKTVDSLLKLVKEGK
ncbi:MAG: hypothetical protein ACRENO_09510, partial [Thermodesulfobacteriota bacterium]